MMREIAASAVGRPTAWHLVLGLLRRPAVREAVAGYCFLLPGLIPMVVFVLLPIVGGFLMSLLRWNLLQPWTFVGLENYQTLVADSEFWNALRVSASFMVGVVPIGMVIALILAMALNSGRRGIVVYRTVYFMPVVTATVAVAMLWRWLYAGDLGLINTLLRLVGIQGPDWLGDAAWALPAVMIMSIWKAPPPRSTAPDGGLSSGT